jgi:hypothetical protein
MNQLSTIVLPPRLNPFGVVSGSPPGDFASDRPGSRFSVYALAMCGSVADDPTTFGQGRCR